MLINEVLARIEVVYITACMVPIRPSFPLDQVEYSTKGLTRWIVASANQFLEVVGTSVVFSFHSCWSRIVLSRLIVKILVQGLLWFQLCLLTLMGGQA